MTQVFVYFSLSLGYLHLQSEWLREDTHVRDISPEGWIGGGLPSTDGIRGRENSKRTALNRLLNAAPKKCIAVSCRCSVRRVRRNACVWVMNGRLLVYRWNAIVKLVCMDVKGTYEQYKTIPTNMACLISLLTRCAPGRLTPIYFNAYFTRKTKTLLHALFTLTTLTETTLTI